MQYRQTRYFVIIVISIFFFLLLAFTMKAFTSFTAFLTLFHRSERKDSHTRSPSTSCRIAGTARWRCTSPPRFVCRCWRTAPSPATRTALHSTSSPRTSATAVRCPSSCSSAPTPSPAASGPRSPPRSTRALKKSFLYDPTSD